ncbi:MAG: hypothetical protein ABI054_01360, partial [Planctomycetota bacterium]
EAEFNSLQREAASKRIAEGKFETRVPDQAGSLGITYNAIDGRDGDLLKGFKSHKGVYQLYELPFDEFAPVYYAHEEFMWLISKDQGSNDN